MAQIFSKSVQIACKEKAGGLFGGETTQIRANHGWIYFMIQKQSVRCLYDFNEVPHWLPIANGVMRKKKISGFV